MTVPVPLTAAAIRKMLSDYTTRTRDDCIAIGRAILQFESQYDIAHGQYNRFCQSHFGEPAEYIGRFKRLAQKADSGDLIKAVAWEEATGWVNPYPVEPNRSNNLLAKHAKALRIAAAERATIRNGITPRDDNTPVSAGRILTGDCRELLKGLPDQSFQCVVTSPPYHASRDYGHDDQIGHEATVKEFITTLTQDVFGQVKRILRDDGVLWLNMGDRIASSARGQKPDRAFGADERPAKGGDDFPNGSLLMIPHRLALAMIAEGWILRAEVVWDKRGRMMPTTRRPAVEHEIVWMFTKTLKHQYHPDAVQVPSVYGKVIGPKQRRNGMIPKVIETKSSGSVWHISSLEFRADTMTPFPVTLAERCILLSTKSGDSVLDPFGGGGTTAVAALRHGRRATLIELNSEFAKAAERRIARETAPDQQKGAAD